MLTITPPMNIGVQSVPVVLKCFMNIGILSAPESSSLCKMY
jgi:hypothetical protein